MTEKYQKMADYLNYLEMLKKALLHPIRQEIKEIIKKSKRDLSISDIYKILNPDLPDKQRIAYKNVYKHIKLLETVGLVKLNKDFGASGQAVIVKYISKDQEIKEIETFAKKFKPS